MIPIDCAKDTIEFDDYYVIKPAFRFFSRRFNDASGIPVDEEFEYNSLNNSEWLTVEDLQKIINSSCYDN